MPLRTEIAHSLAKCGPTPAASASPGRLAERRKLRPHPRSTTSETAFPQNPSSEPSVCESLRNLFPESKSHVIVSKVSRLREKNNSVPSFQISGRSCQLSQRVKIYPGLEVLECQGVNTQPADCVYQRHPRAPKGCGPLPQNVSESRWRPDLWVPAWSWLLSFGYEMSEESDTRWDKGNLSTGHFTLAAQGRKHKEVFFALSRGI